jgi:hypothetical protein
MRMETGSRTARVRVLWRLLVAVDVLIVTVFAVVAAIDHYHVLEGQGVEIHNFQGLLPTIVVVVLRSVVLAAERHLLPVTRGPALVLASRLASAVGFFYVGRWLSVRAYGRWQDVLLGGTAGYALVGVASIGLAAAAYALTQVRVADSIPAGPHGQEQARDPAAPDGHAADPSRGDATSRPDPVLATATAARHRQLARDSLFGLVGVFLGIAGLVMNVTNVARIAAAIVVAGVAVAGIAYLLRRQTG